MKRVVTCIVLGAAAGVCGIIVYELTDQRILGWLIISIRSALMAPATSIRISQGISTRRPTTKLNVLPLQVTVSFFPLGG